MSKESMNQEVPFLKSKESELTEKLNHLFSIKQSIENHKTHRALEELVKLLPSTKQLLDQWEYIDINLRQGKLTAEQAKNEYSVLAASVLRLIDDLIYALFKETFGRH